MPGRYRWILLLASSCYFYMYFIPVYILILFTTIIIDYFAGIAIENSINKKKLFLVISLITNISILAVFKYYNFLNDNITTVFSLFGKTNPIPYLNILLPIGLSFHTFQAMSYTIEVYRGNQKAERHFGIYALYVMFYPQLVAGPIERPQNLLHQFHEKHSFDIERIKEGLKMMLWGYFKKCVIADRVSIYVNQVYDAPHGHKGFELILATVLFAIQIYCDFSGYSDIAIGAAKVMGFKLMTNFNRPYFSRSISEFWKRWHISLSSWFKDYVYIPLGGKRVKKWRWYYNLFITFLISGLWHGANFTYLIWGGLNGLFLIIEIELEKLFKNRFTAFYGFFINSRPLRIIITFICINFTWIFFRAKKVSDATYIIKNIFVALPQTFYVLKANISYILLASLFLLIEYLQRQFRYSPYLYPAKSLQRVMLNTAIYSFFIWSIIVFGEFGEKQFIYFQF
jgi:D-alanyl-lipoteichoic acid acyltransferase DltB (MBOAT superfamily)